MDYDVIIVGAGPAGNMTAKVCAQKGLKTLVLEKDNAIGEPKRCAEGISVHGFERVGLKPNKKFICQEIDGATLWSPSNKSVDMKNADTRGYVLERKVFEKHLAKDAIKAGADYMVRTTVTSLLEKDGKPAGVAAEFLGEKMEFEAPLIIGADGVESQVGKMAGLRTNVPFKDYISGFQYEMAGIKNLSDKRIHLWFGNDIAPKGYMWVFPKGNDLANVGIGIIGPSNETMSARKYLENFIKNNPQWFSNASPVEVNAGGVPVSAYMEDPFVVDNLMLVGDAAQQVNPIHGGGMSTNLYAAQICGRVAAEAIDSGDLSAKKLSEYEREWKETDGVRMQKLLKLRYFLEKLEDKDFEYFAEVITSDELDDMQKGKTGFLLKKLATKPSLLRYAMQYIRA